MYSRTPRIEHPSRPPPPPRVAPAAAAATWAAVPSRRARSDRCCRLSGAACALTDVRLTPDVDEDGINENNDEPMMIASDDDDDDSDYDIEIVV